MLYLVFWNLKESVSYQEPHMVVMAELLALFLFIGLLPMRVRQSRFMLSSQTPKASPKNLLSGETIFYLRPYPQHKST